MSFATQENFLLTVISCLRFPAYREALIEHLLEYKVAHWDKSLRELVAKTLGKLAVLGPIPFQEQYLPRLISTCLSEDLTERHGSILSVAEILLEFTDSNIQISEKRFYVSSPSFYFLDLCYHL